MARRKYIEDEELIALINQYCLEKGRSVKVLKLPLITEYVQNNGYPAYRVESLRRNEKARAYINELTGKVVEERTSLLVTHKALNVNAFLAKNHTHAKLVAALTALDNYYKSVCDNALSVQQEFASYRQKASYASQKADSAIAELDAAESLIKELKSENAALKKELAAYKSIVSDYIYPDIADQLLKEQGILSGNTSPVIAEGSVEAHLITAGTMISVLQDMDTQEVPDMAEAPVSASVSGSNVIEGLFQDFND